MMHMIIIIVKSCTFGTIPWQFTVASSFCSDRNTGVRMKPFPAGSALNPCGIGNLRHTANAIHIKLLRCLDFTWRTSVTYDRKRSHLSEF